ncbi:MAG: aconitase X catalytic domain-containing protein [Chloroflexota bacterium]|nr:aconitase X catalytic domain-containing protein [Chloroflexota bacterium]
MKLTAEQQAMLDGEYSRSTQKAMEILAALGEIYGAECMLPVSSVQIAGVSYDNLGEAGLQFLTEMADGGGRVRVLTTLNPAGMDVENWQALGIDETFAENQMRVLDAFARMGVVTTCTCTPYLSGNLPHYGEHIAWAESSAVCFANSVIGARTNREGGPSALAAALTGFTPAYGMHLRENRLPGMTVEVLSPRASLTSLGEGGQRTWLFGAVGKVIGEKLQSRGKVAVPYIQGIEEASLEELKSFCASVATYGGVALFHMEGVTPEAAQVKPPAEVIMITAEEIDTAVESLNDVSAGEVDFVSLGCPHLSIKEIARVAELLDGKQVTKEFWITTARPTKLMADRMGYTAIIEASGAKFATDTCCVVAPIKGRFNALATDSAKACYYATGKNEFKTRLMSFDEVVGEAVGEGLGN